MREIVEVSFDVLPETGRARIGTNVSRRDVEFHRVMYAFACSRMDRDQKSVFSGTGISSSKFDMWPSETGSTFFIFPFESRIGREMSPWGTSMVSASMKTRIVLEIDPEGEIASWWEPEATERLPEDL